MAPSTKVKKLTRALMNEQPSLSYLQALEVVAANKPQPTVHHWVTMTDDPESEGWIGETNDLTCGEYLAIMRGTTAGTTIAIDPAWIHRETTTGIDPTELQWLDLSDYDIHTTFGYTLNEGRLLRVEPVGPLRGNRQEVVVGAVHHLADFYVLPGTAERRLLDFFLLGTETERDPMNDLWDRTQVDGFGDPVYSEDRTSTEYEIQGNIAQRRSKELGLPDHGSITCVFPAAMLYAVQARGYWTSDWTPEGYRRIAGRFEAAFGIPMHPDDDVPTPSTEQE